MCAAVETRRRCGSQSGRLGSERSIKEAEQRDLIEALKSWKHFLWSRTVTVGNPALSSQNGFYWTGAESGTAKSDKGLGDREPSGRVFSYGASRSQTRACFNTVGICLCVGLGNVQTPEKQAMNGQI